MNTYMHMHSTVVLYALQGGHPAWFTSRYWVVSVFGWVSQSVGGLSQAVGGHECRTAGGLEGGGLKEEENKKDRMVGETLSAPAIPLGSWTWQPGGLVRGGIPPPRLPQGHNHNQTKP